MSRSVHPIHLVTRETCIDVDKFSSYQLSQNEISSDNPCSQHLSESHCPVTALIRSWCPMSGLISPIMGHTMAFERRLEAVVIGPGKPGQVRVALGRGERRFVADVPVDLLQPALRMPNSEFVAVVSGRDVVRVEPAGHIWLTIQDQIR